jgi:hypothetical protein
MLKERVLAPLIGVALLVSIATIAWSTKRHRKIGPLALTLLGSGLVACGRLFWSVPLFVYAGGAALLAASFWNLWIKRRRRRPSSA